DGTGVGGSPPKACEKKCGQEDWRDEANTCLPTHTDRSSGKWESLSLHCIKGGHRLHVTNGQFEYTPGRALRIGSMGEGKKHNFSRVGISVKPKLLSRSYNLLRITSVPRPGKGRQACGDIRTRKFWRRVS